jgi:dynein heavy chain
VGLWLMYAYLILCAGASGGGASESAVRSALKDYMEKLPEPFVMLEIEARIKEKTPFVVVALQEVRHQGRS